MCRIVVLFAALAAYAVARYVAWTPENLEHLPALVLNKAIAMGAALCFAAALRQQWRRQRGHDDGTEPATWFRAGMGAVVAHVPLSLAILRPAYFQDFFAGERLSLTGEAIFLFGALTAAGVYLLGRTAWSERQRWWLSLATMSALLTHVLVMGAARGLNIERHHGYLPPMWLASAVGVALGIGYLVMSRPARRDA
jgi:hypothetical protein